MNTFKVIRIAAFWTIVCILLVIFTAFILSGALTEQPDYVLITVGCIGLIIIIFALALVNCLVERLCCFIECCQCDCCDRTQQPQYKS